MSDTYTSYILAYVIYIVLCVQYCAIGKDNERMTAKT